MQNHIQSHTAAIHWHFWHRDFHCSSLEMLWSL